MVKTHYNFEDPFQKGIAKAVFKNANVSLKYSIEFGHEIKGMRLNKAQQFISDVVEHKRFLPLKKYDSEAGHKPGRSVSFTKAGRFPERTGKVLLDLLASVKSNADYLGLDSDNLIVAHFFASQGFGRMSSQTGGRISGKRRKKKSAHLEIIVREAK